MASTLGLRQRRFMPNTKKIIDAFKKLPFEKQNLLEAKFERIRRDHDGITFVNPRYIDFFNLFRKKFLFDNAKSEEFDVYPLRVWTMSDVVIQARRIANQAKNPSEGSGNSAFQNHSLLIADRACDSFRM